MGQIIKARLRKVLQLHTEAKAFAQASKQNAEQALRSAWECGKELNAIREEVPHGSWEKWCKECIPELSRVTIFRYRKLASEFIELPEKEDLTTIRQLYLLLGIGDGSVNVSYKKHLPDSQLKPSNSFLNYVNGLMKWLNEEHQKKPFTARDKKELSGLKRDLKPVYERLRQLFEDPPGKESLSRTA